MKRQILTILVAGLIVLMHPTASHATLLDFMYSFSNASGNVSGTVTGEVFGLTANATGPASNVIVDSYPTGLLLPTPPLTIFSDTLANSFTVSSSGVVTAAAFFGMNQAGTTQLELNDNHENGLFNTVTGIELSNGAGLNGIQFTLEPSAVPEPSALVILGTALAGFFLLTSRTNRRGRQLRQHQPETA
jgi:hypothetical protein